MLLRKLRTTRRYSCRGPVDILTTYHSLRKRGHIAYLPKKWNIEMVPKSWKEICIPCLICNKVVYNEGHFKHFHAEFSYHDLKALASIGRVIMNRLCKPGSTDDYKKGINRAQVLLDRMQVMFEAKNSTKLKRPGTKAIQLNRNVVKTNDFLNRILLNPSLRNSVSVSLDNLELNRADQTQYRNLFCIICGKWVVGNWVNHRDYKHKKQKFTKQEHDVILLYSARLKAYMISKVLFVKKTTIKQIKQKTFFEYMESCHYALEKNYDAGTVEEKLRWFFGCKAKVIVNPSRCIHWKKFESIYGRPLKIAMLNVAYTMFKKLYAKDYGGFSDARAYMSKDLDQIKEQHKRIFIIENPANSDGLNFIFLKGKATPDGPGVGHIILEGFDSATKQCKIFDGSSYARTQPLSSYVKGLLLLLHADSETLAAGHSQNYTIQEDAWSCGLRAIFCSFALLMKKNPEEFDPVLQQIFYITKFAIENNGRRLRYWTLDQIWSIIATKKTSTKITKEPVEYETLA